ncbi:MAG: acetone carboxylase subunit gamma [Syntrophomonadaceae bacterium]|jgi:acetone carboxylase gamma subunit
MARWSDEILTKLAEGNLDSKTLLELQRAEKDEDRFDRMLAIEQKRVPWKDKIILVLQENLYIVEKDYGARIVKCMCGHEFGDYRQNWKMNALVYARDTEEKLNEIYRGDRRPDPTWCILREFYCPKCGVQLDVETAIPGYPIVFNFLPDLEGWEAKRKAKV